LVDWLEHTLDVALAGGLVLVNGYFVAAEFALVKLRPGRLDALVAEKRRFATTAQWLAQRLDAALAACQLGITMASLGLGWIGEPAFAALLAPAFASLGIDAPALLHGLAFLLAFTLITSLHLVLGEQVPKIFAIRQPERLALWCAPGLRAFYLSTYPLLVGLSAVTSFVLRRFGVGEKREEMPHTDDEIRVLLHHAREHGELTRSEHKLINAVLEFDDIICRTIMLPRADVVFFDVEQTVPECLAVARRAKHTRYPVCEGSLDRVLGIVHLKDLVGAADDTPLRDLMRPPRQVPETLPISRLLPHFQSTRNHMAIVIDEYGTVIGIVTLENVLEEIVGPVEDEFDVAEPEIVPESKTEFVVLGGTSVDSVNEKLGLALDGADVDTFSGLLTAALGRIPEAGDVVQLAGATAHVLEARGARATRVRVTVEQGADGKVPSE
jgi:CBS domain containing-hemolysin-like protein